MTVIGYKYIGMNCTKTFLKNNNSFNFSNRPSSYVVILNDKIKLGHCNNLYNRITTYNNMYKNVKVIHARGFPPDSTTKYNEIFTNRLAKITKSYYHDVRNEETILKSVKSLTEKKYNILDLDYF